MVACALGTDAPPVPNPERGCVRAGHRGYGANMSQSLTCVLVHVVFSTKGRRPLLDDSAFRGELHAYIGAVSGRLGCPSLVVGGSDDHIHILARLARTIAVSDWVKEVKRVSSSFAKGRVQGFAWQSGYGAFSVDPGNKDRVAGYIGGQAEHHRKASFQAELRRLLAEHGVEWDERYVWD